MNLSDAGHPVPIEGGGQRVTRGQGRWHLRGPASFDRGLTGARNEPNVSLPRIVAGPLQVASLDQASLIYFLYGTSPPSELHSAISDRALV
jgi:hypothetical protein